MPNKGTMNARNRALKRGIYKKTRVYGDIAPTVGKPVRMLGNSGHLPSQVNGHIPPNGMRPIGTRIPLTTVTGR